MKNRSTRRLLLCTAVLASLSACAQFGDRGMGGGRGGPPGGDDGGVNGGNDRGGVRRTVSASGPSIVDQIQSLLQEVADDLKLTPRQLVLWERYQEKVGALMADQMRLDFSSARRLTALQQIDARVATVRNRLAAMEDVAEAARTLYDALDPEQKKIADLRLAATVPPLYSGLVSTGNTNAERGRPGAGSGGAPQRREGRGSPN